MKAAGETAALSRVAKSHFHKITPIRFGQWSDVATIGVMG